jgi:hypothetical protein
MTLTGFNGNRPVILSRSQGYGSARVSTPGPEAASDNNQRLAHKIAAGLTAYDFSGVDVASYLVRMSPDLQQRLGAILFNVINAWASVEPRAGDPLANEHAAARVMLSHLRR